jgi:integrase
MDEKIRYVTRRVKPSGRVLWYWQRPGHKLVRLPDNKIERITMAERLNGAADNKTVFGPDRGTIGWVIEQYRTSDQFAQLRPGTVKYYKRYLRDIEGFGPALPFSAFTRRAVVDFIESYPAPHQRRQAAAVLKNLFGMARYYGVVEQNQAAGLRLKTSKPRDRLWTDDEVKRWLAVALTEDAHMLTAFLLLQYTAQRPGDMLGMTWAKYRSGAIILRQEKTDALLEVPCHPVLRSHLDSLPRDNMMIVHYRGRPVPYLRFNERFRRISKRTGLEGAQARDLRRTAMVRMAEAGATVPQIASVSGHSIDSTQRILETYLPRNRELAAQAIAKLSDYKKS